MAAPTSGPYGTTSVIYDPTGVDTLPNPINDGWVTDFSQLNHSSLSRSSNRIIATGNGLLSYAQAYRADAIYGLESEYWMEIPIKGGNGSDFNPTFMVADPNISTVDFYQIALTAQTGTDTWDLWSVFNNTAFHLVTASLQEVAAGDYIGASVRDDGSGNPIIKAWYWALAGSSWTQVFTFTDSTPQKIVNNGFFALEILKSSTWACGKIYGGNIIQPVPPIINMTTIMYRKRRR